MISRSTYSALATEYLLTRAMHIYQPAATPAKLCDYRCIDIIVIITILFRTTCPSPLFPDVNAELFDVRAGERISLAIAR